MHRDAFSEFIAVLHILAYPCVVLLLLLLCYRISIGLSESLEMDRLEWRGAI